MGFISTVICLLSIISLGTCYLEYDGWINIELRHALDSVNSESFSYRGNVTIPSLNSGLSNILQDALTDKEYQNLKALAKKNMFYRLSATVVYANGVKQTYMTSTKACSLLAAQLNDILWVSIDGSGFVTAVSQTVGSSATDDCSNFELPISELEDFNTDVLIKHTELAPVPDTASFIQKVEREREARERGEVRDNRGFFAKYWMYIVPVLLLVFISGATNQDNAK
ncbi:ER membrane protein complex subunit 10 [Teleopsis dalmanni]|uniref:ER membrane protein complex subunit 10 n=1 Tax=Teleopsis dalmanni TaxID=139649 RepID=UPI0018CEDB90|nr:ER membrane protein complex subunit 10 [Teleopsis dalmanni]